jgi:hypothetical protein
MMKYNKIIYLTSLLFAAITTFIFFFFGSTNTTLWETFLVPLIFFTPIIVGIHNEIKFSEINLITILGFVIGHIIASFLDGNSIWPISLVIWFITSIPAIVGLNLISMLIKKTRKS